MAITQYVRGYQDAMREVLTKWSDEGADGARKYAQHAIAGPILIDYRAANAFGA